MRHIPEKGVAFVEFTTDDCASISLSDMLDRNLLVFPSDEASGQFVTARITFAKK